MKSQSSAIFRSDLQRIQRQLQVRVILACRLYWIAADGQDTTPGILFGSEAIILNVLATYRER